MNGDMKVLHIGIASRQEMKARTLAIARGQLKPGPDDPKVWFTSVESLAQVLSSKNRLLLELIRSARPGSVAELAQLSHRAESNLSRTLRTMERYGLVILTKADRRLRPEVPYARFSVDLKLGQPATT
ncbi:MAG: HVO_A0114 family putative DNA-binding protein [Rhodospirillales bacterium]